MLLQQWQRRHLSRSSTLRTQSRLWLLMFYSVVYSLTEIFSTTTETVTSYTTTATVTTTSAFIDLKRRNEVEVAARAAVTDLLEPVYKDVQARQAAAGTSTNFDATAISEGLVSACSCLYISPGTNYITATASTSVSRPGRANT